MTSRPTVDDYIAEQESNCSSTRRRPTSNHGKRSFTRGSVANASPATPPPRKGAASWGGAVSAALLAEALEVSGWRLAVSDWQLANNGEAVSHRLPILIEIESAAAIRNFNPLSRYLIISSMPGSPQATSPSPLMRFSLAPPQPAPSLCARLTTRTFAPFSVK